MRRGGRSYVMGRLKRQITRIRHRRGHGVHSPYIYAIVREVFMCRTPQCSESLLSETLVSLGVKKRRAQEIENLRHHCGLSTFGVDVVEPLDMVICSTEISEERIAQITKSSAVSGTTVVILDPYKTPKRGVMCDNIIAEHTSTTVSRVGYLILFNNHLPKQHFVL